MAKSLSDQLCKGLTSFFTPITITKTALTRRGGILLKKHFLAAEIFSRIQTVFFAERFSKVTDIGISYLTGYLFHFQLFFL